MKVAYYGEQAPKSLWPLLVILGIVWAGIMLGVIVVTGGGL